MVDSERERISVHLVKIRPRGDLIHAVADGIGISGQQLDIKRSTETALGETNGLAGLTPNLVVKIAGKFRERFEMTDRAQGAFFNGERRDDGRRKFAIRK